MKIAQVFPAWYGILQGRKPFLSVEVTRECPLRCPGCYAYSQNHVDGAGGLRDIPDLTGDALVEGILELTRRLRPLHLSLVGGEPLVRYRELSTLLPLLSGVEVQLVTSAVRPIPLEWAGYEHLHISVSVDGLPPEHDRRRAPATYERVLSNIAGHSVIIHCTVTKQMLKRPGYLREFASFWSARPEVRRIWLSLFTPQEDQTSEERLTGEDRTYAIREIKAVAAEFPKVYMPGLVLEGYVEPPRNPAECIFAQVTTCISADLKTVIRPCEFGGRPVCAECGCLASAGIAAIGRYRIAGLVRVGDIFNVSKRIGGITGSCDGRSHGC
ncbi:MAG TPA: radical SAM protein [Bryobacteraceae bacterium]|nr:radical SAM protein [Bryobacteraceae bacterium]